MKIKYLLTILITLITLSGKAQSKLNENVEVEKLLIGEWNFIKTVDEKTMKLNI
ncbi:hypothetical protein ACFPVY_02670 [Flavobacterium qiangtangense]|uniref:Uncharacterized protein n=1 Tax=Flavobacterium qiangtangense TaxID=1442595 RepID=A0ABW1PK62_9FLAO